jgi:outer membrane receptor protein involved in Fe transport
VKDLGPWSGTLHTRYFGPRPLIEDNSVRSRSTINTAARAAYKVDAKTTLSFDVFNLFNRKASDIDYYYASQLRNEAAPVNDIHFHPVEPRTFRLALLMNY